MVNVVGLDAGTATGEMDPMDESPGNIRVAVCVAVRVVEFGGGATRVGGGS